MTIINSLHILLCCRENCACRQRCLLLCQGGGEKSRRLQKERGEKRMGSKNNGAHTERLVSVPSAMFGASDPPTTSVCVLPPAHLAASPSPPLLPPLQRCLPWRTAGSSRISSAALLHIAPITDYSLSPPLLDLKFGEVEGHHFSLLSSVSNMILAGRACVHKRCRRRRFSRKKKKENAFWVLIHRSTVSAISRSKRIIDQLKLEWHFMVFNADFEAK